MIWAGLLWLYVWGCDLQLLSVSEFKPTPLTGADIILALLWFLVFPYCFLAARTGKEPRSRKGKPSDGETLH